MVRILLTCMLLTCSAQEWVWRYEQEFDGSQREQLLFSRHTPAFTQLIIGWNACRPACGYYLIEACVKLGAHSWSEWLTIAQWGAQIQESIMSTDKTTGVANHYVRMEMPEHKKARAFRVRITAHDNAPLSGMKRMLVTVCDKKALESETNSPLLQTLPYKKIEGVPRYTQMVESFADHAKICSPASAAMVAAYWLGIQINPVTFAPQAFDAGKLRMYGNWSMTLAAIAAASCVRKKNTSDCELTAYVTRLNSIEELHNLLMQNIPVCVSVTGKLPGQPPYATKKGHLLVVIGIDTENGLIYTNDPSFKTGIEHTYDIKNFVSAWYNSHYLAYLIYPTAWQTTANNLIATTSKHHKEAARLNKKNKLSLARLFSKSLT